VIVDPPSYQKGSFVATKDYARLLRRLFDLMLPGGHALLCLNAPELGVDFLQDQVRELAPELEFVERVANPAVFADVDGQRSLKVLVYRAPPLA
jgi:23S rRNA (cytosine1962-C5)-methyltransferase